MSLKRLPINSLIRDNNKLEQKINETKLKDLPSNITEQISRPIINFFDSGWLEQTARLDQGRVESSGLAASVRYARINQILPSSFNWFQNVELDIPSFLLPFMKVSIITDDYPNSESTGILEYTGLVKSGDNLEIYGDSTLLYKGFQNNSNYYTFNDFPTNQLAGLTYYKRPIYEINYLGDPGVLIYGFKSNNYNVSGSTYTFFKGYVFMGDKYGEEDYLTPGDDNYANGLITNMTSTTITATGTEIHYDGVSFSYTHNIEKTFNLTDMNFKIINFVGNYTGTWFAGTLAAFSEPILAPEVVLFWDSNLRWVMEPIRTFLTSTPSPIVDYITSPVAGIGSMPWINAGQFLSLPYSTITIKYNPDSPMQEYKTIAVGAEENWGITKMPSNDSDSIRYQFLIFPTIIFREKATVHVDTIYSSSWPSEPIARANGNYNTISGIIGPGTEGYQLISTTDYDRLDDDVYTVGDPNSLLVGPRKFKIKIDAINPFFYRNEQSVTKND